MCCYARQMSESPKQFIVRFPPGMRERIANRAKANERSMNSEIVEMLTYVLDNSGKVTQQMMLEERDRIRREVIRREQDAMALYERLKYLDAQIEALNQAKGH